MSNYNEFSIHCSRLKSLDLSYTYTSSYYSESSEKWYTWTETFSGSAIARGLYQREIEPGECRLLYHPFAKDGVIGNSYFLQASVAGNTHGTSSDGGPYDLPNLVYFEISTRFHMLMPNPLNPNSPNPRLRVPYFIDGVVLGDPLAGIDLMEWFEPNAEKTLSYSNSSPASSFSSTCTLALNFDMG